MRELLRVLFSTEHETPMQAPASLRCAAATQRATVPACSKLVDPDPGDYNGEGSL